MYKPHIVRVRSLGEVGWRRTADIGSRKPGSVDERRVKTGGEGQQRWDHIRLVACSGEGAGSAGLPFREQARLESGMYGARTRVVRLVLEAVAIDGRRLLAPTASTNFT